MRAPVRRRTKDQVAVGGDDAGPGHVISAARHCQRDQLPGYGVSCRDRPLDPYGVPELSDFLDRFSFSMLGFDVPARPRSVITSCSGSGQVLTIRRSDA
jgi:hypothetical protein